MMMCLLNLENLYHDALVNVIKMMNNYELDDFFFTIFYHLPNKTEIFYVEIWKKLGLLTWMQNVSNNQLSYLILEPCLYLI